MCEKSDSRPKPTPRVKVCGICTGADIDTCVRAGVDALGFVVEYPDSVPWNLSREDAALLLDRVPPFVTTVVVTTGDVETIVELAIETTPDVVQLHGDESMPTVERVVPKLATRGIKTLKAIPIDPREEYAVHQRTVAEFEACTVDGIVIDAKADGRRGGGTGRTVPWDRANRLVSDSTVPVVLAGGLTPETVGTAITTVDPFGVDVISGVESQSRMKDPAAVEAFVAAAKRAGRRPAVDVDRSTVDRSDLRDS